MVIAIILDPRGKLMFVKFVFNELHSTNEVAIKLEEVKNSLYEVFDYYVEAHNATTIEHSSSFQASASNQSSIEDSPTYSTKSTDWKKFDQFVRMVESTPTEKSELDIYLEEGVYICDEKSMVSFDALEWWRNHKLKYRILSVMATYNLVISISSVASEATFSAGGRVIDTYRASLAPKTVQALICGGDWVRNLHGLKKK